MAQRVDQFPDQPSKSIYPWDDWLDGAVWELEAGTDFRGTSSTFRSVAIVQARKRGGKVRTRLIRSTVANTDDKLYIQFFRAEPERPGVRGS
jgi:hypothetical protein